MRCLKAALALAAFLLLASCSKAPQLYQREAYVFGTRVEVSVWGESADQAKRAMAAVLAEFDRLHRMLHAWQPSELTALNEAIARGERDIAVSPELTFILRDAAAIAARSDQLFNPAIGRLVGLWGFHSDEFKPVLPDAVALEAAVKAQPRLSDLAIGSDRVSSTNRAVQLDLGGYAKGYALDRAAALLRGQGVKNALINIGGNVMALGSKGGSPGALASSIRAPLRRWPRWSCATARPSAPPATTSAISSWRAAVTATFSTRAAANRHKARRRSPCWSRRTPAPAPSRTPPASPSSSPRPGTGAAWRSA